MIGHTLRQVGVNMRHLSQDNVFWVCLDMSEMGVMAGRQNWDARSTGLWPTPLSGIHQKEWLFISDPRQKVDTTLFPVPSGSTLIVEP